MYCIDFIIPQTSYDVGMPLHGVGLSSDVEGPPPPKPPTYQLTTDINNERNG